MPISMKLKIPEIGSKQLRKGRYSEEGYFYFVTTSSFNKKNILARKDVAKIIFDTINWLEKNNYIDCYFIIIMPNHLHLVFQLFTKKTLSEVIKSLKGFTGRKIKENLKLDTPVWQDQFYDHLIRKDENLVGIMKYCLYNPVRRGLVENPLDYPYWKCKYDIKEQLQETSPDVGNTSWC